MGLENDSQERGRLKQRLILRIEETRIKKMQLIGT